MRARTTIRRWWPWLLAVSVFVRLLLAPLSYGFQYDMDTFGNWAATLVHTPLRQFYATAAAPDHLPGDLYLHLILAKLFQLFGDEAFDGAAYRFWLKAVPSFADLGIALLIYWLVRQRAGERIAAITSLAYALNPATIFLSAVWGQWDAVSGLVLLAGIAIVWAVPGWWVAAIPIFAWVVLIKPPLALLAVIALATIVLAERQRGKPTMEIVYEQWTRALAAVAAGVGTILLLILPFDTGLPGMGTRWSLLDRVQVAVELYPFTTLGAANVWMLPLGTPKRESDVNSTLLGVTEKGWGNLLFIVAIAYMAVMLATRWRHVRPPILATWGMVVANYAYFLLPTRSHERYMFPALMLAIVMVGLTKLDRRVVWIAAGMSFAYFANLVLVYGGFREALPGALAWLGGRFAFTTVSLLNCALFLAIAAFPWWWVRSNREPDDEAEGEGTPLPVYADDAFSDVVPA